MKRLTLKLGLIIFIISLISCDENKKNNYIYFSAQIENPNSDTILISEFYGDTALVTFNLKERKVIRDSMILPMAFYRIGDGNETTICFLKPGFDLFFSPLLPDHEKRLKTPTCCSVYHANNKRAFH